ncbi:MAG: hypothetical protein ACI905_000759 [Roseivirga sp.]
MPYEKIFRSEVVSMIKAKQIKGFHGGTVAKKKI